MAAAALGLAQRPQLRAVAAAAEARDAHARDGAGRRVDVDDDARRQGARGEQRDEPQREARELGRRRSLPSSLACCENAAAGSPSSAPSSAAATVPE